MKRTTLVASGAVVAIVLMAVGIVLVNREQGSDCDTVRSIISENQQFNSSVESEAASGRQPGVDRYRDWAAELSDQADLIEDPGLSQRAGTLATLADQTVSVVEQFRADPTTAESSATPEYAEEYARLGEEFNANLLALDQACTA